MKLFFTFLLSTLATALTAQNNTILKGRIVNSEKQALPLATVQLLNIDGALINTVVSDSTGAYHFSAKAGSSYYLQASFTGYKTQKSAIVKLQHEEVYLTPDLVLPPLAKNLTAVTVSTTKKLYEIRADKLVMNIENNPVAAGNSVFEVVKLAPAVTVDKDDNLLLKGAGTQIYIDGRPAYLSGQQLTEYLKSLPADIVATIEIITNPSSKYDAAGSSGIININLKKNKLYGINGMATLGGGIGSYSKANGGLGLNYRKGKINIYGNSYLGYSETYNELNLNSIMRGTTDTIYQNRNNYWHPRGKWWNYTLGMDYAINNKTTFGILFNGSLYNAPTRTDNTTNFLNAMQQRYQSIQSVKKEHSNTNNNALNLYFKKTLDSLGSEVVVNADYGNYARNETDINNNNFYNEQDQVFQDPYIFRNNQPAAVQLFSAKLDYTKYFSPKTRLEAGAKYSLVTNDNNLIADSLESQQWVNDNSRSNHFIYREQIAAAYTSFMKDWGAISAQVGLRAEQTIGSGESKTLNQTDERNYLNLFPTVFLSQKLDSVNTLQLNYARRISRPSYQSLNPFVMYVDPYTVFKGNPYLRPSYSNSFELKHIYKQLLFTTLSYRFSNKNQVQTIQQDAGTGRVTTINENAGRTDYVRLDVSIQLQPVKWWSAQNNIGINWSRSLSDIPGFSYDTKAFSGDLSSNHSFTLNKNLKLTTNFYYSAPGKSGIAKLLSSYAWSVGAQQQLWNQKASIRFNIYNLLSTHTYRAHYLGEGIDIVWRNEWEGRRFNLSFVYKFGNQKIKAARERNTSSEEKNRISL